LTFVDQIYAYKRIKIPALIVKIPLKFSNTWENRSW